MQHKWSNILTLLLALRSSECCGTPSCSKIHHLLLARVLWFLRFVSKAGAGSRGGGDRQFCYVNGRPVDLPKVCSQFKFDRIACTLPHSRSHLLARSLTHTKNDLLTQSVIDSVTHSRTHFLTSSLTQSEMCTRTGAWHTKDLWQCYLSALAQQHLHHLARVCLTHMVIMHSHGV